jgi:hypothetical protein
MSGYTLDGQEMFTRVIKYLMEGLVVGLVAYLLPSKGMDAKEALMIALVGAAMFAVLDLMAPSIGASARNGAGLGLGFGLVGFP